MVHGTFVRSSAPEERGSEGCAYTSRSGPSLPDSIPPAAERQRRGVGFPTPRRTLDASAKADAVALTMNGK